MANHTTPASVAIPYAKAAFQYACQFDQLAEWSVALNALASVVSDPVFCALLKNPKVSSISLGELIVEAAKSCFSDEMNNFIYLLAQNHRLIALPMVAQLFEEYRAMHEKTLQVSVTSSYPLSKTQEEHLMLALKIRLQRDVKIQFENDPTLLGGAIIKVNELDLVIDRSVKNTLARLANDLISL